MFLIFVPHFSVDPLIADKIWYLVTSKVQRINEQQPYKIFWHKKLHNEKMRNLQHVSESLLDLSL
jgi:hypothetical protein